MIEQSSYAPRLRLYVYLIEVYGVVFWRGGGDVVIVAVSNHPRYGKL